MGPPMTWIHALHQVTGLFALRGNKMTGEDRAKARELLARVLKEMDDDKNWIRK